MLLINFSKKASVIVSRINPRIYLMLFLLDWSDIFISSSNSNLPLFSIDPNITIFEHIFIIILLVISLVTVILILMLIREFGKNRISAKTESLLRELDIQKQTNIYLEEGRVLLVDSASNLIKRSGSINSQLYTIFEDLDVNQSLIRERLSVLVDESKGILITAQVVNKYLT